MKTFIIEQKITALVNQYMVYDTDESGTKNQMIAFAQQKRFNFKEEIIFYSDDSKKTEAFRVKAENVLDFHGKFLIADPNGKLLGAVRKAFKASLLRSTWHILEGDEPVVIVQEKSNGIAVFRRVWGFIPYLSDFPFFIKYHFVFTLPQSGEIAAEYIKTTRFRDHYRLDIHDDKLLQRLGWETFVAQGVLLDALQGR